MSTVDKFRAAVEARDLSAVNELFAPDARFFSPAKFTPFVGIVEITNLLSTLLGVFENFHYVGGLAGEAELTSETGRSETEILVFRAEVGGKQIHGIDMIQLDTQGLISEFTVMVRPVSALVALGQAVQAEMDKQL